MNSWQGAIKYGQAAKMIDLVIIGGYQSRQLDAELLDKARWFVHVPLDEYVLVAIRNCAKTFPGPEAIRNIPSQPSMGFVTLPEEYKALQSGIRSVAKQAQVPPLVLNFITWTASHPE